MRRTAPLLLTAALICSCGGPAARPQAGSARAEAVRAGERKGRIVSLSDVFFERGGTDTVRFGRLRSGETAVVRFWIANDSPQTTAILSYDRNCGCTTLKFNSEPIAPGDAQRVEMSFDSRGTRGWQLKTLDVTLAGAQRPLRLYAEAEVE